MLGTYLPTIWHSASSLLARCTSYEKNHFCRQEDNQDTKFTASSIHLLTLLTQTALPVVPDLTIFSKQLISYVPQKASGVMDCRQAQTMSRSVWSKTLAQPGNKIPLVWILAGCGLTSNCVQEHKCRHNKGEFTSEAAESQPYTSRGGGLGGGTELQWTNLPQLLLN